MFSSSHHFLSRVQQMFAVFARYCTVVVPLEQRTLNNKVLLVVFPHFAFGGNYSFEQCFCVSLGVGPNTPPISTQQRLLCNSSVFEFSMSSRIYAYTLVCITCASYVRFILPHIRRSFKKSIRHCVNYTAHVQLF